ncbi:MAG: hypothetical protein O2923_03195 [Verrucomicrobia bacterium]|nr:hypothetical protein [Verrucomicrobiota bacterium]MDA1086855.1 hypothetical protein [Verrucomicrobiota bacterium]
MSANQKPSGSCPLSQREIIEKYFMENRSKILDIAAFLDRLDRATEKNAEDDFRYNAFRAALERLLADGPARVKDIQMLLSDPNTELLDERDQQHADGANRNRS